MTKVIDVTGLNSQQIAMIEEIVTALKIAAQIEKVNEQQKIPQADKDRLKKLHEEFSWLVTDLGVKEPLNRSKIYDIE